MDWVRYSKITGAEGLNISVVSVGTTLFPQTTHFNFNKSSCHCKVIMVFLAVGRRMTRCKEKQLSRHPGCL